MIINLRKLPCCAPRNLRSPTATQDQTEGIAGQPTMSWDTPGRGEVKILPPDTGTQKLYLSAGVRTMKITTVRVTDGIC